MLDQLRKVPSKTPLLIFLVSAAFGVWAAYDPIQASAKFTQLVLAVIIYFIVAAWPLQSVNLVSGLVSGLAAALAVYFLGTADWVRSPADLGFLNRIALPWMELRPTPPDWMPQIHPNIAGGVIAALLPFSLYGVLTAWKSPNIYLRTCMAVLIVVGAAGLLMTSSRAAWFALAVGLAMWLWWKFSKPVAERLKINATLAFAAPLLLALLVAGAIIWSQAASVVKLADLLPGSSTAYARAEIAWNSLHLARDFFFTGGGLAAFPGLYSRYMRVIQVFEFGYAHNLYLDLLVEQGIFGLAAFLMIIAGSVKCLWRALRRNTAFAGPVMAGMAIMLLHGFLDDAFYGMGGTSLLFLLPGFAALLKGEEEPEPVEKKGANLVFSGLLIIEIYLLASLPFNQSGELANLAAVQMAKSELAGWTDHGINQIHVDQAALQPVEQLLQRAVEIDPANASALYRLGMIAMAKNDFTLANGYLIEALTLSPGHLGIRKMLGYNFVWLDQPDLAVMLLSTVPEAVEEMGYYYWWWGTQDREDLAVLAHKVLVRLRNP